MTSDLIARIEAAQLGEARKPDAWLYEGPIMVFKYRNRRSDLVAKGYAETPLFYGRASLKAKDASDD